MKSVKNNNRNQVFAAAFEGLETRTMMSATVHGHKSHKPAPVTPAAVTPVAPAPATINMPLTINQSGNVLNVTGTTGNDLIDIAQSGNTFTIKNGSWSTTVTGNFTKLVVKGNGANDSIKIENSVTLNADVYGAAGDDTIIANNGNDRIFTGAGKNTVTLGNGNDTVVALGSTSATITAGTGLSSFWMDDNKNEVITNLTAVKQAASHVHKIGTLGAVTNPAVTDNSMTYKNFSNLPLFSDAGPSENDIVQGYVGDCWFLSSLSAAAKVNPDKIMNSVVDMGDGTYAVQFNQNGKNVFVHVDANLPTWYNQQAYASTKSSTGTSQLWVAIMEKAMAQFNGKNASYSNIDGGWMDTAFSALGMTNTDIYARTATDLGTQLLAAANAGKALTVGINTAPAGSSLIGGHAYTVDKMIVDATGKVTAVVLRNPWGVDGAGNDGKNDGYVTINISTLFTASYGATAAI